MARLGRCHLDCQYVFFLLLIYIPQLSFMDFDCLYFFAFLVTHYPDVAVNPGPERRHLRCCRVPYANVRGLYAKLRNLSITAPNCDDLFCSETMVSSRRHVSELRINRVSAPTLILTDDRRELRGPALYVRD